MNLTVVRCSYLVIASLVLSLVLALYTINELRVEQGEKENVIASISTENLDLEEEIERLFSMFSEQEERYQAKIHEQEEEYKARLLEQIRRNDELMAVLYDRYQNYITAMNLQGAEVPVISRSGFTAGMFERVWQRLNAAEMKGSGEEFVKAEQQTGVNALILAAIAVHESNAGKSAFARQNNNYFGWGGGRIYFPSREDSIMTVARQLRSNYLSRSGRFYRGDNLRAINVNYAADQEWACKVAGTMRGIARHALQNPGLKQRILEGYQKRDNPDTLLK